MTDANFCEKIGGEDYKKQRLCGETACVEVAVVGEGDDARVIFGGGQSNEKGDLIYTGGEFADFASAIAANGLTDVNALRQYLESRGDAHA